jgi:hypothetical protein
MKLYEVPRNSIVRTKDYEFYFFHIDGMFSLCKDKKGQVFHLLSTTDVISYYNNVSYEEFLKLL